MKFLPLFELSIQHPYYTDARCPDLRVEVEPAGDAVARGHGLIIKARPDGILVLAPVDNRGSPRTPLRPNARLTFRLLLLNADLALVTDLPAKQAGSALVYSNYGENEELAWFTSPDDDRARPLSARGVFAWINISGLDTLQPKAEPARFTISLKPRIVTWVYYVVSDVPAQAAKAFRIVDGDPSPSRAKIGFGAVAPRDLVARPDAADRVAIALAAKYPAMRRLRFVSDGPVACTEEPRRFLELHVDGNKILEALPNPAIRPSVGSAFCVVEHRLESRSLQSI